MPPFVQITNDACKLGAGERLPDSFVARDLRPIRRQRQVRIWAKVRRDFLRLRLLDAQLARQQRGIMLLEALSHLLPAQGRGRLRGRAGGDQSEQRKIFPEMVSHDRSYST